MDDLPDLPFELIVSYLNFEDRLKARSVSKRWRQRFDFEVTTLCYSDRPIPFIMRNAHYVSDARNFISSIRFAPFFDTFGPTILSNLKHLRICDLRLNQEHQPAFASALQSFSRLEKLDLIRLYYPPSETELPYPPAEMELDHSPVHPEIELELNLPVLLSIQIDEIQGNLHRLTLDAPSLREIKFVRSSYSSYYRSLNIVHGQSVERLIIDHLECTEAKNLKNLQFLYISYSEIDLDLLNALERLKEIHLNHPDLLVDVFRQKQTYGRSELKIYLYGLLLNGPNDPLIGLGFDYYEEEVFTHLVQNSSRMADELPLCTLLQYSAIERVARGLELDFLKRLTDLSLISVYDDQPIRDAQRFLDLLKSLDHVVELAFYCAQPQELFDRLPDYHGVLQGLSIQNAPSDFQFLFRLRKLNRLFLQFSIDLQLVRRAFEELPFFYLFNFRYKNHDVYIVSEPWLKRVHNHTNKIRVTLNGETTKVDDLDAAIQLISETLIETKQDSEDESDEEDEDEAISSNDEAS